MIPTLSLQVAAAGKLLYQSLRHPNTDKQIIIDRDSGKVEVEVLPDTTGKPTPEYAQSR